MDVTLKQGLSQKEESDERYEELGLPQGSKLYGRDAERKELMASLSFDGDRKESVSLVGVYGITGIGKSFLVKHAALQLMMDKKNGITVIYVDASGMTTLSDVLVKLLKNPAVDIFASGSKDHMMGLFRDYLIKRAHQQFILIFDDLSTLLDNNEQSEQVYGFLRFLLETRTDNSLKVKMMITSQVILEHKNIVEDRHKGSVKDFTLDFVDDVTSKQILQCNQTRLDCEREKMFLDKCHGHPFSLYVVSELTSIGFEFSEDSDLDEIANIRLKNQTDQLFQKALNRLEPLQQQALLACSLFDSEVQVDVLYELLNQKGSLKLKQFTDKLKHENLKRFWLKFRDVPVDKGWVKSKRMTLAHAYHSLVRQFLKGLAGRTMEDESASMHVELLEMKKRFVCNQMSELVEIGRKCLQHPQKTCQHFLNQKVNIRTALEHTVRQKSPELLFAKLTSAKQSAADKTVMSESSNELRCLEDILYLFLAFHEYHDSFDGKLIDILVELLRYCNTKQLDPTHGALIRTLHLVILRQDKDWVKLDETLKEMDSPKAFSSILDEQLSLLNDAMIAYARGKLYTSGLHYADDSEKEFSAKRMECLEDGLRKLDTFPRSLNGPVKYFSIQIMMVQAEAEWLGIPDLNRIHKAYRICVNAEKFSKDAYILKPLALLEKGKYLKNEANVLYMDNSKSSYDKPEDLYIRSQKCFDEVIAEYRNRDMQTTTCAAATIQSLVMVYICLGNSYTRDHHIDKEQKEERRKLGIEFYRKAVDTCDEAIKAFTILNSASKLSLVKSITLKAEVLGLLYEAIKKDKSSSKSAVEEKLRLEELQYRKNQRLQALIKAYNYYLTDPQHCDLVPGKPTYNRVFLVVQALKDHPYDPDQVKKVEEQLQIIEKNFERKKKGEPPVAVDTTAVLMEEDADEASQGPLVKFKRFVDDVTAAVGHKISNAFVKK